MSMVSIITVDYKQPKLTVQLLHSINKYGVDDRVEVIVVDNGSLEDNELLFQSVCPGVVYIRSLENLGFAGGNNLGAQYATGSYMLFLNNDTEITEGFIDTLCKEMERHPEFGLLSPLILYYENQMKIQYAGFTPMDYLTGRNRGIGVMEDDVGQYDNTTAETGYCHGAAMLCRKVDLERVGLMEEHFFLYYEELDWCEKFKRAGFKMGFTGKAKVYHKESMSVGKESPLKTYFMTRNRWLFIRRNAGLFARFVFAFYFIIFAVPFAIIKYAAKRKLDLATAVLKGVWWNIIHSAG